MARYDTQATISCADPSIFKHLNIEASEGNLRLRGAITQKEGLKYAMVKMESVKGSITTRLMCHTLEEGRILLSNYDGKALGCTFSVPDVWPGDKRIETDKEWAKLKPSEKKETQIPEKFAKELLQRIEDHLHKHDKLSEGVTVTDPNSIFRLLLKSGSKPWFAKQYPIQSGCMDTTIWINLQKTQPTAPQLRRALIHLLFPD